jgi:hypothetical protein
MLPVWVTDKTEIAVYKSKSGLKLSNLDADGLDGLTKFIAQWSVDLGIVAGLDAFELTYIENWVKENYPDMTLGQMDLAKKLALTRQLDVNPVPYGKLSPLYIGGILNAYKEYEERVDRRILANKKRLEDKLNNQDIEPETLDKLNREARQKNYLSIKNSDKMVRVLPGVWDIAVKNEWVNPSILTDAITRDAIEKQLGRINGSPDENPMFKIVDEDDVTKFIKWSLLKEFFTSNEIDFTKI